MAEITQILNAVDAGDPHAAAQLLPLVYDELRKLAAAQMACEKPGHTLDATALVHEAYVRLAANEKPQQAFANRRHFFAAAAEAMRRILVENARRKRTLKRGGGLAREYLEEASLAAPETDEDVLAVDEALDKLAARDPAKAELVKLRYFGGLTVAQAAATLGISTTTADRYWAYARAWLYREITRNGSPVVGGAGEPANP
jgi:RNA polymerase sigma factor (TIGR02999 family)